MVEEKVIVELKSVEQTAPVHYRCTFASITSIHKKRCTLNDQSEFYNKAERT